MSIDEIAALLERYPLAAERCELRIVEKDGELCIDTGKRSCPLSLAANTTCMAICWNIQTVADAMGVSVYTHRYSVDQALSHFEDINGAPHDTRLAALLAGIEATVKQG